MATAEEIYGKKNYNYVCPECKSKPITEGAKFAFGACIECALEKLKANED